VRETASASPARKAGIGIEVSGWTFGNYSNGSAVTGAAHGDEKQREWVLGAAWIRGRKTATALGAIIDKLEKTWRPPVGFAGPIEGLKLPPAQTDAEARSAVVSTQWRPGSGRIPT
jgi:hypothetical protein